MAKGFDSIQSKLQEGNRCTRTYCQEAPKYKHFKYEAEKEHRIVKIGEMSKFRKGEDGLPIPYIEVGIPLSYLQKIIIGPCKASNNNVKRVKALLHTKLLDIPVENSIIPYRNRT